MNRDLKLEPPLQTQFRLWHLFAAITWVGVAMAFFASEEYWFAGVVFIVATACISALRVGFVTGTLFTALTLLICILALPTLQVARINTRRGQCMNNLKQVALALMNYEHDFGTLPPAYIADANGKPMHSWRVLILPYLEQQSIYKQYRFDEPWDGPNNRLLHSKVVPLFCCPSESVGPPTNTSYVAVVGNRTAWPGEKSTSMTVIEAADGARRTILLVETHNSGIHWMEPRDLTVNACLAGLDGPLAGAQPGTQGNHHGGNIVSFADGHFSFLPHTTTSQELNEMLTVDDGKPVEAPNDTSLE